MSQAEFLKRGLTRQEAISYMGVKSTYFDKEIRPRLRSMKLGTSLIFDRHDLDIIFEKLKVVTGDVGPSEKGVTKWPKEPQEFFKQKMDAGGSTKLTKELDFRDVLTRIRKQKAGC